MFVKPDDLVKICKENSLILDESFGVKYNVISDKWNLSSDKDINYMARFKKI